MNDLLKRLKETIVHIDHWEIFARPAHTLDCTAKQVLKNLHDVYLLTYHYVRHVLNSNLNSCLQFFKQKIVIVQ